MPKPWRPLLFAGAALLVAAQNKPMPSRLVIVDPGHFHASLLQREMYPELAQRVSVYAPLGPELLDYLNRVSLFNSRAVSPTHWEMNVHTSADPMAGMLRDKPGDIVLFTGRNRGKIDRILASLQAKMNVFADKPWIISAADMPKLEQALTLADQRGLAAYDIMTERFEITSELQRAFVSDPEVFGTLLPGTAAEPGIKAKSIHHIMKVVAGVPLKRPAWFFDTEEYGEGLSDVGTHVVDLVQWTAFPDQAIDYKRDIEVYDGRHWPVRLTAEQFQKVTGGARNSDLDYYCNNSVHYKLRGVNVALEILWNWEAPAGGGDVYEASFRGSKITAEIRQGQAENWVPQLYLRPATSEAKRKVAALQSVFPGLSAETVGDELRLVIPEPFRVSHEAHFAQVAKHFFEYVKSPKSMPAWERPNMLAKYYVSTKGVELARRHQ